MTVTQGNFDDIPDVMRWGLRNSDAIRLMSFLPVAEVGRTREKGATDLTLEAVWEKICEGLGGRFNSRAMIFGHPQCNITTPLLACMADEEAHLIEVARDGKSWDQRWFACAKHVFRNGIDAAEGVPAIVGMLASRLAPHPFFAMETVAYAFYRLWGERAKLLQLLQALLTFKKISVRPILIVAHQFMSTSELETSLGKERLQACVFQLPVDGKMVSMCEMNASGLRKKLNLKASLENEDAFQR